VLEPRGHRGRTLMARVEARGRDDGGVGATVLERRHDTEARECDGRGGGGGDGGGGTNTGESIGVARL
jgi:hypothetical protein